MAERFTLTEIREAIKQNEDLITRKRLLLLEYICDEGMVRIIERDLAIARETRTKLREMANTAIRD